MRIIGLFIDKKNINLLKAEGGLRGEKTVLHLLEKLSDAYNIYRGLQPGTHGDIDLTVVGPTGVFTLEVKSHSGQIDFNGQELTRNGKAFDRNILHQAFGEARALHKYLWQKTGRDIFVTPIIVFSSNKAFLNFNQNKIDNVYVVKKDQLLENLGQKQLINFEDLSVIENALTTLIIHT
jgi:hypothetical protein